MWVVLVVVSMARRQSVPLQRVILLARSLVRQQREQTEDMVMLSASWLLQRVHVTATLSQRTQQLLLHLSA